MDVQKSTSDLSATASLNRAASLADYHRIMLVHVPPIASSNCTMSLEDYSRTMLFFTRDQMAALIMSNKASRAATSAACNANNTNNSSCVSALTALGSGRLVPTLAPVAEADSLPESRENEHRRHPRPS
jgi:hypothetical protein